MLEGKLNGEEVRAVIIAKDAKVALEFGLSDYLEDSDLLQRLQVVAGDSLDCTVDGESYESGHCVVGERSELRVEEDF